MLAIILSFAYAIVGVATRKMQAIHYAVVLYYYAVFAFFALLAILITESLINNDPLRLLAYTWR